MALDLPKSNFELSMQSLKNTGFNTINTYGTDDEIIDEEFDIGFEDDASIYEYDYKSPKKAFLYSLIIPGWGQKYAETSTLKTLAFIGFEAGFWMGFFNYRNDGNKKTDEYEAFANLHWLEGINPLDPLYPHSYRGWLDTMGTTEEDYTHTLPSSKSQQYYEMIGKYDQFRGGWDDYWDEVGIIDTSIGGVIDTTWVPGPEHHEELYFSHTVENPDGTIDSVYLIKNISSNRSNYNSMRSKANDLLNQANQFVVFSILNHLLSAVDAAISANRYNKKEASEMWLTFRADMRKYSATEEIPIIRATLRF